MAQQDNQQPTLGSTSSFEGGIPPRVTHIAPAIFVPLEKDITQPFDAPRDRIERAGMLLESVEFHKAGVREGLLHLTELERRRILGEAKMWEAEHGPQADPAGLHPDEADAMLANMYAPAVPGVEYNVPTQDLRPNFFSSVDDPHREDRVRQLQRVEEDGLDQLAGYEGHIEAIKRRWTDMLEKEKRMMAQRFGRGSPPPPPAAAASGPADAEMEDLETG